MTISRRLVIVGGASVGAGLALLTRSWRGPRAGAQTDAAVSVITSFSILDDMVRRVGGDRVTTHALVPAGADAHAFEPAPADAATLATADAIFAIGLDFEPWLAGLIESTGTTAPLVEVAAGVPVLEFDPETGEEHPASDHADEDHADDTVADEPSDGDHAEDEDGHAHGEFDPHIWHDVSNALLMVATIRDGLIAADSAGEATYAANADAYLAELADLDAQVQAAIDTLAPAQRKLVTSHDALGYYARRYGLTLVGTAFGSISTEGGDPSAAQIATLVQAIKDEHVAAIFAENVSNPALMEAIAAEAGVTLAPPLYTDALTAPDGGAPTYIDLITVNTTTIVDSLGGN